MVDLGEFVDAFIKLGRHGRLVFFRAVPVFPVALSDPVPSRTGTPALTT